MPAWQYLWPEPPYLRRHPRSYSNSWWTALALVVPHPEWKAYIPNLKLPPPQRFSVGFSLFFNSFTTACKPTAKVAWAESGQLSNNKHSGMSLAHWWHSSLKICASWVRESLTKAWLRCMGRMILNKLPAWYTPIFSLCSLSVFPHCLSFTWIVFFLIPWLLFFCLLPSSLSHYLLTLAAALSLQPWMPGSHLQRNADNPEPMLKNSL